MTLPKTMQAAILVEQNKPLVIDEVELPPRLEFGQVLVKIHYSGICGSQIGEIVGAKGEDKYLPHLLGHEASGTVIATGPGVKHVKPDDLVVLHWRKGLGIESAPPHYTWQGKKLNAGWVTTFNEYAIVAENRITAIPHDTDWEAAALFGCAITTGFGVIENNAQVKLGESVVVFGSGGIGLNIVQAAALVGAHPIIAVDLYDNRLELAKTLGATHTINASQQDAQAKINEIVGKNALDIFIDNTGQPKNIELGYAITHAQGRVILVGVPKHDQNITIHSLPLHFGKKLTGSFGGEAQPHVDIKRYLGLLNARHIDPKEIISQQYNLNNINDAIADMKSGLTKGRCIVNCIS